MYVARPNGADSATINPAALSSPELAESSLRGRKRVRSPGTYDARPLGDDGIVPSSKKRRELTKSNELGDGRAPQPAPVATMPSNVLPPHTPQSQGTTLPPQTSPAYAPPPAPAPAAVAPAPVAAPPKTTPTKSTLKALPTVRDHTTDQLSETGDEYVPREIDEFGEKKVMPNGTLLGNRVYKCRTFLVPHRGDKLFMLATECARVLGYRDSYLLFNKNRSLYKIIANQAEKDDLVQQEILPFSYRSRQIAIVTARSMFRQFGSRVIEGGRRVRDDYWEQKARKQGFTEADAAGEKRPGASKAREAAEAQNSVLMSGPHTEIVYNTTPGAYPGPPQPPLVQDIDTTRSRDYNAIVRGGPRQEISGPPYHDQTRPSPLSEIHSQAGHAAEFNKSVNQQREMRGDYLQGIWRRPHEQPPSNLSQPVSSSEAVPPVRAANSPHTTVSGITQPPAVASQSPQMMMTQPPYSQPVHAQASQTPMRAGSTSSASQGVPNYNYQPGGQAMWQQNPQTPQHSSYGSYTTQPGPAHPSQSPAAPHLRQPSSGQLQPSMQFPGMQYSGGGPMYPAESTPRQYMPQNPPPAQPQQVSQGWSGQQPPPAQQWWGTQQPQ